MNAVAASAATAEPLAFDWASSSDRPAARRARLKAFDEGLAQRLFDGADVEELVRERTAAIDRLCSDCWKALGLPNDAAALVATGGFGRGELFPHSDLDLLVLVESTPVAERAAQVEAFFAALWDCGFKLGHAVRTVAECVTAAADLTVATTLSEARLLGGSAKLFGAMAAALREVWTPADFEAAKRSEQAARHARFHDTASNLEPNLKEGPGGLRDLHVPLWIARQRYGVGRAEGLVELGWLSVEEYEDLTRARRLLWRYRFGLHALAGRPEERLLFEHQRSLAERFGHRDERSDRLAVEQLMQAYFRAAHTIAACNERLLQRFVESDEAAAAPTEIDRDFVAVGDWLAARDDKLLVDQPAAMVRLFRVLLDHPELAGPRSSLLAQLDRALRLSGGRLAGDDGALAEFLAICRHHGDVASAFDRMARLGVLSALIPAFAQVSGRMQYDLFHVYTVDRHTLAVIANIRHYGSAAAARDFPLAHSLYARLRKPELLLLAGLFHDIAKGRGGDHSELGEVDALTFCRRLGLSVGDAERVAWLVRQHLLMSVTAQKNDIGDPEVVHRFATTVSEQERLDLLYLLTVADIRGTSPKLWNSWKDRLLADLHAATRYVLRRGLEHPVHASERRAETRALALALLVRQGIAEARVEALWAAFPEESFLRYTPEQIAWQSGEILAVGVDELPLIALRDAGERGATEVFVYSPDRDGLFATLTAVLDRFHLSVLDARIATSRDGYSLDTFLVLDADGERLTDRERAAELVARLSSELSKAELDLPPARRSLSRQQQHFRIPTRTEFSTAAGRTQLALVCSDRPGILAHVAQAFRACALRVHDARIATFGERVEDFFVLSEADGSALRPEVCEALAAQIRHEIDGGPTRRKKA